jgi:hypothetical protein
LVRRPRRGPDRAIRRRRGRESIVSAHALSARLSTQRGRPAPRAVTWTAPIPVGPEDAQLIRAGRVAWHCVRGTTSGSIDNWVAIVRALCIGQRLALSRMSAKSGAGKRAFGGGFNKLMGVWLRDNGFDDIDPVTRSDAVWLVKSLIEVREWLDNLSEAQRRGLNSPGHIRKAYNVAQRAAVRRARPIKRQSPWTL